MLNALAHVEAHITKHIYAIAAGYSIGDVVDEAVKNRGNYSKDESAHPRRNVDDSHQAGADKVNSAHETDKEATDKLQKRHKLLAKECHYKTQDNDYVRNCAIDGIKEFHKSSPDIHDIGCFSDCVIQIYKIFPKLIKSEFAVY
jgi:hypothetical protein